MEIQLQTTPTAPIKVQQQPVIGAVTPPKSSRTQLIPLAHQQHRPNWVRWGRWMCRAFQGKTLPSQTSLGRNVS